MMFEEIKQNVEQFKNWQQNTLPKIIQYYKGDIELQKNWFEELSKIKSNFEIFFNKIEILEYEITLKEYEIYHSVEELYYQIEYYENLWKFLRTNKNAIKGIEQIVNKNSYKLIEEIGDDIEISVNNDLLEVDWEYDKNKLLKTYKVNNQNDYVTSFFDKMEFPKFYGKDIDKNIEFKNNDFQTLTYQKTLQQTVDILLSLKKGDILEFQDLGVTLDIGETLFLLKNSNLFRDLKYTFSSDDLFEKIELVNLLKEEDYVNLTIEIYVKSGETLVKNIQV